MSPPISALASQRCTIQNLLSKKISIGPFEQNILALPTPNGCSMSSQTRRQPVDISPCRAAPALWNNSCKGFTHASCGGNRPAGWHVLRPIQKHRSTGRRPHHRHRFQVVLWTASRVSEEVHRHSTERRSARYISHHPCRSEEQS